jgi:uncharacterized protein YjbJ (UPF0337 family)
VSPGGINKRSDDMDKDRIAGAAKETKGAIKETAGKAVGNAKLTAEGKSEKAQGKVQNAIGGLKDALKKKAQAAAPGRHSVPEVCCT